MPNNLDGEQAGAAPAAPQVLPLRSIRPQGLLSFGPRAAPLELRALNVLIGVNGVGKSNLVDLLGLVCAAPGDLPDPVRTLGGGISEWIWKGDPHGTATVEVVVDNPIGRMPVCHRLSFRNRDLRFELVDEAIENQQPDDGHSDPYFYYRYQGGDPVLNRLSGVQRGLQRTSVSGQQSVLSQLRDPEEYPVLAHLQDLYRQIAFYREWSFGRRTLLRQPQATDVPSGRLFEDCSNLAMVLSRLLRGPQTKQTLLQELGGLFDGLRDVQVSPLAGHAEIILTERNYAIPAVRLSDGTLRYLCLLTILCDPDPPPVICLEEPELGLHPDLLPRLAQLLLAASERSQLIVTTHSDIIVDALTETPEAVVVASRHEDGTVFERLGREGLAGWLDQYRLGGLWLSGELGGTRW
ncbi:MAG: AAA family ATPase [Fimbriimonadaceae bacterium]|nr:AAA family ATPase [Fimbriimonadaceae bacterium]